MAVTYHSVATLFNAVDFSASATSVCIPQIGAMMQVSVQLSVTSASGPLTGTWTVQVSNDPRAADPGTQASAAWDTVDTYNISGTGTHTSAWSNGSRYCQAVYTFSSGTGTGSAWLCGVST